MISDPRIQLAFGLLMVVTLSGCASTSVDCQTTVCTKEQSLAAYKRQQALEFQQKSISAGSLYDMRRKR